MWSKMLYVVLLIVIVLASVKFTKAMMKKFKLNRWIIGSVAPFVLIIPSLLFDKIHPVVWNILSIIFSVMCIMFFEISRNLLEEGKYKGVIKYSKK